MIPAEEYVALHHIYPDGARVISVRPVQSLTEGTFNMLPGNTLHRVPGDIVYHNNPEALSDLINYQLAEGAFLEVRANLDESTGDQNVA